MKNIFRKLLNEQKPIMATRIHSTWPMVAEVIGATGLYDYIEFLGEYAPFDQYDLENIARACELHHLGSIIKVDYANRDYIAQKALASGFQGVLFTDHATADDVARTIQMIKPASPEYGGKLGYIGRRWYQNEGFENQMSYAKDTAQCVVGFMIEKKQAVENIEEICKISGIDFLQFGPADYSMNSGFNAKEHKSEIDAAERKVIETAIKYGISIRVELNHVKDSAKYLEMGVNHFALGSELRIKKDFWMQNGKLLREKLKMEK